MQMPVENRVQEQNQQIPDFIRKLYSMMEQYPQVISFSEDGIEVHIHDYNKFVAELLPRYFRHRKWRSFIRQMNMYSFRKVNRGMKTFIFINGIFRKGNQNNYAKIKRKINTREEEQQAQTNLQSQMKLLVAIETQNAGVPNHPPTQNPPNYSLNTLPSLTSPPPSLNMLSRTPPYSNSILQFLSTILEHRKKTEQICSQIKQNMEYITKQRKSNETKNIMNTVKDSMQMIDQISNKFKQKMEVFVDDHYGSGEELSNLGDFNVMEFIGGNGRIMGDGRYQGDQYPKQNNTQPTSYPGFNLLIPEPITTRLSTKNQEQKAQHLIAQNGNNTNNKNYQVQQNVLRTPAPTTPPPQPRINNNTNMLGLTPQCSFSSVTYLLNLDKQ